MSLIMHVAKLRATGSMLQAKSLRLQQSRTAIRWGGFNHVVVAPPEFRWPFWQKMTMGTFFVCFLFSYPLYITYMMHEWDKMDPDLPEVN